MNLPTLPIEWSEELSSYNAHIDYEHQKFLNNINKLITDPDLNIESEVISEVVNEVMEFTRTHFDHEEKLFDEFKFPNSIRHKEKHREFLNQMSHIAFDLTNKTTGSPTKLLEVMIDLLRNHIIEEVEEFRAFFGQSKD